MTIITVIMHQIMWKISKYSFKSTTTYQFQLYLHFVQFWNVVLWEMQGIVCPSIFDAKLYEKLVISDDMTVLICVCIVIDFIMVKINKNNQVVASSALYLEINNSLVLCMKISLTQAIELQYKLLILMIWLINVSILNE